MFVLKVPYRFIPLLLALFIFSSCRQHKTEYFKVIHLKNNWFIQSTDSLRAGGKKLSSEQYTTYGMYPATVPSTVLHALTENKVYTDIFRDDRLKQLPTQPFTSPWWYRTQFEINRHPETVLLHFDGINYKANIWLNGVQIADTSLVKNPFRRFQFNISKQVHTGKNTLAVEVFPPVKGDFSIGFVDWNPAPPDNSMGIFRPVNIEVNSGVGISKPYVVSRLSDNLTEAQLTASVELTNYTGKERQGDILLTVNGKELNKKIVLRPKETKKIVFTPAEFHQLKIKNPHLWWPHTLGRPHLYTARFEFHNSGTISDRKSIRFGIRTVSDYFTKEGHRGFKINGKKILIRGGGWVDRLLLDDTEESVRNQLEYVKDMNLNTIRLEGFWGNDQTLYNLCDSMGILIMTGWSCHWEWEEYLGKHCDTEYGGILSDYDMDMMSHAWQDQIIWLRNHPSIFVWLGGSDCKPKPELEKRYKNTFAEYDSTRVYLSSAKEWTTPSGNTGVKMRGPYDYEPPVYWFADTLYGGAFGFNTETGPGAQVPPLESIQKMMSPQHLWPIDSIWDFHCGRHAFNSLNKFTTALEKRYGKAVSIEEYTKKAQVMNYELMRPMFEAFSARRYRATGVIQWMLNSAWPEMYWQLYDFYLMPNGAYFGAKKASQPHHALFDYAHHSVFVVNDKPEDLNGCTLKVRIYDALSQQILKKELPVDLKANSSKEVFTLPEPRINTMVYFIDLRLLDSTGKEIDNNFYWLSKKEDMLDYKAKVKGWNYYTPSSQYADFTQLNRLPPAKLVSSVKKQIKKNICEFTVKLSNTGKHIAFFVHVNLTDSTTGQTILPVLWSDNDISLLPEETRIIKATVRNQYVQQKAVKLKVNGYNVAAKDITIAGTLTSKD